ncbi:MAG: TonB-dependent receptor [Proteobacteria bacterium]|nr:TonB-dependent receptor [Pseudomonadota bacterium]
MNHEKITSKVLRTSLLAGAALVALSTAALADTAVETVVVTGSRLTQTGVAAATPTVSVNAADIAKSGHTDIGAVLAQIPQVQITGADLTPTNSNFLTSGFGVWNVDLRALGPGRTLVLVNGRRQVTGSPTGQAVDLNTIPTQLIDRIEVITGGASAVYGSDAMAGVVNIILKDNFEGLIANAQAGITSRGDGADTYGALTLGGNFLDGRGNVTISVLYDHSGTVLSKNRDISSTDSTHVPGLPPLIGTHGTVFGSAAYSSYGLKGRYRIVGPTGALSGSPGYDIDGTTFSTAADGFDRNPNRYIQVPLNRKVVSAVSHYDITDDLRFILEATYALSSSSQQLEPYPGSSEDGLSAPVSAGGTGILIPVTNPFIPAGIQTRLAAVPGAQGLYFYRRFADLGDRTGSVNRDMEKITGGFEGSLPLGDWKWSAYYEWGRTAESQFNGGYYDKIRMQQALNSHIPTGAELLAGITPPTGGGGAVCDDPIARAAGCVPINLFGANAITPQAAGYVGSQITLQDEAIETVAQATAHGTVVDLPAGPLQLSVGTEYRREQADFVPDQGSQGGTVAGNQQSAVHGAYQTTEGFAEVQVPVLADMPFAKYVELNGAYRFAHYSTAGDADGWRFGGKWMPTDTLTFRATESYATRAPNISELFSPTAQTFPSISKDPCSNPSPGSFVETNCNAQIAALGPGYGGEPSSPNYNLPGGQAALQGVGGYTSGNPTLKPETAHTFTGGVTYQPEWLPGFQATVDYYDIRVNGAIGSLSSNDTLNACYQADPALFATNIFCQQIIRAHDAGLGPIIKQINFPTFNLGSIKTSGVDGSFAYAFDMADLDDSLADAGSWSLRLDLTYLDSYTTDPGIAGTTPIYSAGTTELSRWKGVLHATYENGPVSVSTTLHYTSPVLVDKTGTVPLDDPANKVTSFWYLDFQAGYDITKTWNVYVGAHNLLDTRPPEVFPGSGYDTTGTSTDANAYDPIGLYMYAGVNVKL